MSGGRPKAIARIPDDKRALAIELARAGRPLELIADKLRISRDTLHAVRVRAREALARKEAGEALSVEDETELEFVLSLNEARADRAFSLHDTVQSGGGKDGVDWRSSAWLLERVHPDVYGSRSKTEITGAEGGPVQVEGRAPALFIPAKKPDE